MTRHLLEIVADNANPSSLSARLRRRRMLEMIRRTGLRPEDRVLDVGGTESLWRLIRWPGRVDVLNVRAPAAGTLASRFRHIVGDGCSLDFADGSCDLVFSNSTIEHVGGRERAGAFASEVSRVGKGYWVQAPCVGFPVEPHFLFPFFQFLPKRMKAWVALRWPLSWPKRFGASEATLLHEAVSIWLPRISDMRTLFPDGRVYVERSLGVPKSVSIYRPVPERPGGVLNA